MYPPVKVYRKDIDFQTSSFRHIFFEFNNFVFNFCELNKFRVPFFETRKVYILLHGQLADAKEVMNVIRALKGTQFPVLTPNLKVSLDYLTM